MILNNTTDIPNQLVALSIAHSIQDGVELNEVIIKNKKEYVMGGQYGWYFPTERKIVIIVPPFLTREKVSNIGIYTKLPLGFTSRVEFLVSVMAHELRHAWQWQVQKINLDGGKMSKHLREVDAERYQFGMLNLWRKNISDMQMKAASKNSQK